MEFKNAVLLLFICVLCFQLSHGAKILGIFPMPAKSHYTLGNSLMRGLAEAGHDVTMISPHNDKVPTRNGSYRNVVLTGFADSYEAAMKRANPFEKSHSNSFRYLLLFQKQITILIEKTFENPNVKELLNSDETFDIVIVEQITNEAFKYFAHHFKAHLVMFSSIAADSKINYVVANPTMISYTPLVDTDFSREMSLYQRIHNFLLYINEAIIYRYHWLPFQNTLLQKYFPGSPSMLELNYNVSLVLVNSHESIQPAIPLVPNMIPIGGFHINKPKSLPQDLQKYLDEATEGVVYASFGSSVKAKSLPNDKKEALLKTFGSVKEKVLWKWEGDEIKNLPSNVKTAKWFPQREILAHPNVKLFITQGGLLSLTETIYNGVPVLVIPIFGDQAMNAQMVISNGYGLSLPFHDPEFSDEKLTPILKELLSNPKYKDNALKRSQIFHDREMDPLQKAVYWIEYVIRHNGAPQLRVWGVNLPWYQLYSLDVIGILVTIIGLIFIFIYIIIKYLLSFITKKNSDIKYKQSKGTKKIKKN
ncbi:unnamed protein product [Psylliodes chrysocephalus]|uniref:UDP-glucuronosyltransferase n=1 Tax=Psylliodes chrysocephalus TaxID=3402493 RepID=A0A9P0GFI4_9CUCU|nr:unnamed protein product [Psylliodes chrysocephala]